MSANHDNNSTLTTLLESLRTFSLLSLLLLLSLGPSLVQCQSSSLYQPISYSASAILSDGGFYLYGGVTKFAVTNTGTSQFLRLDLTKSFSTLSPPWTSLSGVLTYTMIAAVPSKDGKQFIIGGNRDNLGTLSYIYDITSSRWTSTPNLPGLATMAGYKRSNLGMSLDRTTGLVYIYGGFQYLSFSSELSILDSSSANSTQMDWTLSVNKTMIPALYEPLVLYLPTLSQTIVLGGCSVYDAVTGLVGTCQQLNVAWLLSNGASTSTLTIEQQSLLTAPTPRYQSCRVVLEDGNVFVQGGKDPNVFFGDAWILNVVNWTWSSVTINGPTADMTRAGHTCQMGPNGQIVIVGGFVNVGNISTYVTPYMAVINSNNWTWTTNYQGAPLSSIWPATSASGTGGGSGSGSDGGGSEGGSIKLSSKGGLSTGAKGGIGAGAAIGILGIGIGFLFWRKRQVSSINQNRRLTKEGFSMPSAKTEKDKGVTSNNINPSGSNDSNHFTYGSGHAFPAVQGSTTTMPPPVAPRYANATYYQEVMSGSSGSDPMQTYDLTSTTTTTTLPTYPGEFSSAMDSQQSLALGRSSNINQLESSPRISGSKLADEAALAAALFQAEDLISSRQRSPGRPGQYKVPVSSLPYPPQGHIPLQHTVVNTTSTSSTMYSSVFTQEGSPIPGSSLGTFSERRSSPIVSANSADSTITRSIPGPQSVPEYEARIERSSPGVKMHVIGSRDVNVDGLFQPLTPARPHGYNSILVGEPAPSTTTIASSFSAAASPEYFRLGPNSRSGGRVKWTGSEKEGGGGSSESGEEREGAGGAGTPHAPPYRDPKMMKDLDDIARLIEMQTLEESKGPHAVVGP